MATMTIRNIEDALKRRLRVRAAQNGRSMEDEARDILRSTLASDRVQSVSLVESIRARVEPLGCVELDLPPRNGVRAPPKLDA